MRQKERVYFLTTMIAVLWVLFLATNNGLSIFNKNSQPFGQPSEAFYEISKVVDGDTFDVYMNSGKERIRLIGVNTPESDNSSRPEECFGREATLRTKEILNGKTVRLEADPTQDNKDKYDRLLRYVYTNDGIFLNKELVEEGYAYEYTYKGIPYEYRDVFKISENRAKENGLGLWNKETCNGKK